MSTANNNSGQEAAPCLEDSCSFHGSPSYAGYCSVCYKKKMSDKTLAASSSASAEDREKTPVVVAPAAAAPPAVETTSGSSGAAGVEVSAESTTAQAKDPEAPVKEDGDVGMATAEDNQEPVEERPVQKKRNRCWQCRKKVGLTGIECRCGYIFCGMHRYADQHECDFDHAALARKHLAEENMGAAAKKVETL